nr:MAG TPA: hypothetical protein [Caudoviricetes sp.]
MLLIMYYRILKIDIKENIIQHQKKIERYIISY